MLNRPLKILIVASWYPSVEHPTDGSFVHEQALMLRDYGHQVTVIHPFLIGTFASSIKKPSMVSFAQEDDISVLRVGVAPPVPFFRGVSYEYCFLRVRKAMKSFQIDPHDFTIIHSHAMFMGGYIGHKLSKRYYLPQVHTEHTSGLIFHPAQYTKNDLSLTRKTYDHCHKVLFVSQFSLKHTLRNIALEEKEAIKVLPNLVDTTFFTFHIPPLSQANSLKFLMIGSLIPRKNHRLLLEAYSLVQKQYPTVGLSIAGNGPLEQGLRELASALKLQNLHWLPKLNREEVKEQMAAHQVIISTSKVETFGLTIAEAQAMGKPVVVTDSGGVRDIVTQETGIITEASSTSFAKGMLQMIQSIDNYHPESIRQCAKQRFSSEVVMQQLHEIYRSFNDENLYL